VLGRGKEKGIPCGALPLPLSFPSIVCAYRSLGVVLMQFGLFEDEVEVEVGRGAGATAV